MRRRALVAGTTLALLASSPAAAELERTRLVDFLNTAYKCGRTAGILVSRDVGIAGHSKELAQRAYDAGATLDQAAYVQRAYDKGRVVALKRLKNVRYGDRELLDLMFWHTTNCS